MLSRQDLCQGPYLALSNQDGKPCCLTKFLKQALVRPPTRKRAFAGRQTLIVCAKHGKHASSAVWFWSAGGAGCKAVHSLREEGGFDITGGAAEDINERKPACQLQIRDQVTVSLGRHQACAYVSRETKDNEPAGSKALHAVNCVAPGEHHLQPEMLKLLVCSSLLSFHVAKVAFARIAVKALNQERGLSAESHISMLLSKLVQHSMSSAGAVASSLAQFRSCQLWHCYYTMQSSLRQHNCNVKHCMRVLHLQSL